MTHPSPPHPDDPWGPRTHHPPQPHGPPPGHGGWDDGPPPAPGPPHARHARTTTDDRPPDQDAPYGLPEYDYGAPAERNTLFVGLSACLGVVFLLGGTAGAVAYFTAARATPPVDLSGLGASGPTAAPSRPASPSAEQSAEPSAEQSEEPFGPAGTPGKDATPGPTRPAPGSPIAHTEFGDWKIDRNGLRFGAAKVAGWTYDTCDPVDAQGVLARSGCERAIQVAYTAYRGHLKAVRFMLAFPTAKDAKTAATRLSRLSSTGVNVRENTIFDPFVYGKIRTNAARKYVVATIVTADETAASKAGKFHLYLQADTTSYVQRRDATVTS